MGTERLGGAEQQQVVKAETKTRGSKPTERLWTVRWKCWPWDKGEKEEKTGKTT